jgi:hypothetical protein
MVQYRRVELGAVLEPQPSSAHARAILSQTDAFRGQTDAQLSSFNILYIQRAFAGYFCDAHLFPLVVKRRSYHCSIRFWCTMLEDHADRQILMTVLEWQLGQ